jgi:hypothetical protein
LKTCLEQDFDDYEVIVSDNFSSPATKAVVDETASPKVRYFRTSGPLAMASNWEFAVSHALGEYLLVVGDDDGLLPHALHELDALFLQSRLKAVRWDAAFYTWPSCPLHGQQNYLRIPLGRGVREVESLPTIRDVIAFRDLYTALPMLYNSAVHRDVVAAMKTAAGRVFAHSIPDVYSGFAVAAVSRRYLSTDVPMSVSGQSGASNGIATLFQRGRTPIDREFREFNYREGLLPDPRIPDLPVFPHVPVADAFLLAQKLFFPNAGIELDRKQFIAGSVDNLRVATTDEWTWAMGLLRASLNDEPALEAWFDAGPGKTSFRVLPTRMRPDRMGFDGQTLHLNADTFGVSDVAAAAELCERILHYTSGGVPYDQPKGSIAWRAVRKVKRSVFRLLGLNGAARRNAAA